MINAIVFSKDRACQLELLVRSMVGGWNVHGKHGLEFTVIYDTSNERYEKSYEKLMHEFCGKNYYFSLCRDVGKFKERTIEAIHNYIDGSHDKYTVFFVDDDVFKLPFSTDSHMFHTFQMQTDIACLSLRMSPRMTYSYTQNKNVIVPPIENGIWDWTKTKESNWSYPMSLDGHIFRTTDILPLIERLDYNNPNELEGQLAQHPLLHRPKMICFDEPIIMSLPVNRVQEASKNRCGNISAEFLNEQFLAGKRIKLQPIIDFKNTSPQQEVEIEFE